MHCQVEGLQCTLRCGTNCADQDQFEAFMTTIDILTAVHFQDIQIRRQETACMVLVVQKGHQQLQGLAMLARALWCSCVRHEYMQL